MADEARAADGAIGVGNEFAVVSVRKVYTRNGERLEITSPRLGYTIRLDALALESLTWQTMETFTKFLEQPFGPWKQPAGVVDVALRPPSAPREDR